MVSEAIQVNTCLLSHVPKFTEMEFEGGMGALRSRPTSVPLLYIYSPLFVVFVFISSFLPMGRQSYDGQNLSR